MMRFFTSLARATDDSPSVSVQASPTGLGHGGSGHTHCGMRCAQRHLSDYQCNARAAHSAPLRQQRAGLLDVVSHLGHECIHAVESLHAAQPVYELYPESVPVQIPVKVQEVGLDTALANVECRIRANRDGRHPEWLQSSRSAPPFEA